MQGERRDIGFAGQTSSGTALAAVCAAIGRRAWSDGVDAGAES